MNLSKHRRRKGAILPLVAVLLSALLIIAAITINTNWILYHQINVQNSTDLAARASLVKILADSEFEGRTDRARDLGARIYELNLDRPDPQFSSDRIEFGRIPDPLALEPVFIESGSTDDPISAVQIVPSEATAEQRVSMLFRNILSRDTVDLNADATVSTRPVDVMLCLDASRSMNRRSSGGGFPPGGTSINEPPLPGSRWFELVDTVAVFLQAMKETNPNARVGLVTFGGGFEGIPGPNFDPPSELDEEYARTEQGLTVVISNQINGINQTLQSYGSDYPALGLGTSLYDGIIDSLAAFDNDSASKHIIMLSDGQQAAVGSRPGPIVAAEAAANDDVTIHTISFGGNFGVMTNIANETAGSNFTAFSEDQLREAFGQLLGRFRVQLVD